MIQKKQAYAFQNEQSKSFIIYLKVVTKRLKMNGQFSKWTIYERRSTVMDGLQK